MLFGQTKKVVDVGQVPRDLPFSEKAKEIFETAQIESRRMGMAFIAPEHIFLAILEVDDEQTRKLIKLFNAEAGTLKVEAMRRLRGEIDQSSNREAVASGKQSKKNTDKIEEVLTEYCRDLCEEARNKRIDPIIGRGKEVHRIAQIIGRRSKNNPILLGEPGVGKTAIAEGLACAIVSKSMPDGSPIPAFLENKRLMQVDVPMLIAGAKERGELESRVTNIIKACKEFKDIILVIDEIHCMVGGGSSSRGRGVAGSSDMGNLFKPSLSRGEIQCIGATTLDEHRRYIESDAALERRFQPVMVEQPTEDDTLEILKGLLSLYERHHQCIYSEEALQAAVAMSSRYIADRQMPDKAIDVLDEAGSRVRIKAFNSRVEDCKSLSEHDIAAYKELMQVVDAKEEATKDMLFEEATLLRTREVNLRTTLGGSPEDGAIVPVVTANDIADVVSSWTGIPVEGMIQKENEALLRLEDAIKTRVMGQDNAVKVASKAVARAAAGIGHPHRPIASLMFCGPTGVGKTELAKAIASHYFAGGASDAASMIRLDMSEYMERHTVSKLIGAPPGYVGFNEGGKLTESVRRNPHSLVLLDEIEKAHPDVFNILLQMLEDGRLTDSQGRSVSFNNCLIVLTSNVGSSVIAKGGESGIGFQLEGDSQSAKHDRLRTLVMEELKNYFRPELLNRMDDIVVFQKLDKETISSIARLEISKTIKQAATCGVELVIHEDVYGQIVEQGYSEELGAREIRRSVTTLIENPLSELILQLQAGESCATKIFASVSKSSREIEFAPLETFVVQNQIEYQA